MRLIKYIPVFILLVSCNPIGKKNILYGKCKNGYLACSQFELKKDSTFEYFIFMDVGGENIIRGKWQYLSKDTLLLNSFNQPKIKTTYYKGYFDSTLIGKVKIQLQDLLTPLAFVSVEANDGKLNCNADENGICVFETSTIFNITYYYLGYNEKINIDSSFNNIQIYCKDLESLDIISDQKVILNKRKITFYGNDKSKKIELKRNRFGKKQW